MLHDYLVFTLEVIFVMFEVFFICSHIALKIGFISVLI